MISVIITTYKREAPIVERAIRSVVKQTYQDFELWIVDDSPRDWACRWLVKEMALGYCKSDKRIHYVQHKQNRGACAARNTGLRLAGGDYIAFLDDDDEWFADKLAFQLEKFQAGGPKLGLVYCGSVYQNDDTGRVKVHDTRFLKGDILDELMTQNFIGGTSFPLLRTDYLKEIGGFDVKMAAGQDQDVWLRIAGKYEIDYVEYPLVIYHMHGGEQITTSPEKRIKGITRKLKKHSIYFQSHKKERGIVLMDLAYEYVRNENYGRAFGIWIKAVASCPGNFSYNIDGLFKMGRIWQLGWRNK